MVADHDVHLGPGPVMGWEEHHLVEKRINVSLPEPPGHLRIDRRILVPEVIIDGAAEASDQPGPRATDGADQEWVLDLHADLDVPSLWNRRGQRTTRRKTMKKWNPRPEQVD